MTIDEISNNCTTAPESALSNSGVAGTGILLGFIITAGLALILSALIVFSEVRPNQRLASPRTILRKILNGLSDQMILEGILIQAIGLAQVNSMIPYHFFIIWMLSLLSTATNFASLLALVQDYKRDWVLRWLRQFLMFVNMILGIVFGIFVLETNLEQLSPTLPIACVWQEHARSSSGQGDKTLSVVGTIVVIAATGIVFILGSWYLHMRKQVWGGIVRSLSLLVLMAMAIGAAVRVLMVSQAFGTPSVNLADNNEKSWSFGQLLTVMLLILPFVSALEIYRGELQVPRSSMSDDADTMPLTGDDNELKSIGHNRYTYQPNPLVRQNR